MIDISFVMTPEMRDTKTRFWKALEVNPICDPDSISLAAAQSLTKEKKLKSWWQKPAFVEWFVSGDEYETKVSSAKFSAIETLESIMSDPDSPASARVAAAKQILDYSKHLEKDDTAVESLLEKISGVNKIEDLKKYL